MMADIVEQLRAYGELPFEGGDVDPLIEVMNSLAHQAANEIEKLRAEIKAINPAIKCRKGCHVIKEKWGGS